MVMAGRSLVDHQTNLNPGNKEGNVEALERICNTFFSMRKDHLMETWLNWRTLPKRFLYRPTKPHKWFRIIRSADFQFDTEYREWLREEIRTKGLSQDVLKGYVLLLENHALRVSGRQDFLGLYAAFTALAFVIFKIISADAYAYIVLGLFAVFALSERTLLHDKKTATEELLKILQFELSFMKEMHTSGNVQESSVTDH